MYLHLLACSGVDVGMEESRAPMPCMNFELIKNYDQLLVISLIGDSTMEVTMVESPNLLIVYARLYACRNPTNLRN